MAEALARAGYRRVYNLEGGIFEWANRGHPVYDVRGNRTRGVHPYDRIWGRMLNRRLHRSTPPPMPVVPRRAPRR